MSGIALRRRSLRSRLGFGPQIRSGVRQLHCCGLGISTRSGPPHIGRARRGGRSVRLVLKDNKGNFVFYMCPSLYVWVGHMMECTAVALDKGRRVVPRRPLTYTSSIDLFLALYEHRCVSLPWSVWGVDRKCNLTDDLVNGYFEAVAPGAPKHKANRPACCKHSMGLEVALGYRSATRYGARELH